MKKISQIVGMPVIDAKGNLIGEVERVVYSKKRGRVLGVIFKKGRIVRDKVAVRYRDIISIGQDVMIIKDGPCLVNPYSVVEISNALEEEDIIGYPVINSEGKEIGIIKDIIFSEQKGSIEGFVVARDLIEDLIEGRKVLKPGEGIVAGNGAVLVSMQLDSGNNQKTGGLKNIFGID